MKQEFNKILVISLQGIGDLLLTTPLFHALKVNFSTARLSVLTFRANRDILIGNQDIDETIVFDVRNKTNLVKIIALVLELRKRHFDLSICAYPSGIRSAFLGYLSGAEKRLGQGLSQFRNYRWFFTEQTSITEVKHAVLMNLDFLKLLGIDISSVDTKVNLNLNDEEKRFASDFLKDNDIECKDTLIAIHAGGGSYTATYRSWPSERFARVADALIEKFKAKVIFIGGKDDEPVVKRIMNMMSHRPINVAGRSSLKQTAALINRARLLICNNSAPMHIAAAIGTPTVSIFGSADPKIHRPWGGGHIVLQKPLECSPCYYPTLRDTIEETKLKNRWFGRRFACKTKDFRCLTSITPEEVLNSAKQILKGHLGV